MTPVTALHTASEYSFLSSTIRINQLIHFAISNNLTSVAITDYNVLFGVPELLAKCKKNNLKLIVGLDLDVENYRLILLAKNYRGYQELVRLSSLKGRKENVALSDIDLENLFAIDHPTEGSFIRLKKKLNIDNYYIPTLKENFSNAIFVNDVRALTKNDLPTLSTLASIKGSPLKDTNLKAYQPMADESDERVKRSIWIASQCNVEFPTFKNKMPKFKNDEGKSSQDYLKSVLSSNLRKMEPLLPKKEAYLARLKHELEVIASLGFEDYFLIIWDLVKWAKSKGIFIGPGRGSSAGSLVSYLLAITDVDPLKFDLIFERFLNPQRASMPDIDIDVQDNRRQELIEYLFKKYGHENVALITTFQRFGAKMAIRDVARTLDMNISSVDLITKGIPPLATLEQTYQNSTRFRANIDSSAQNRDLFQRAKMIEGLPRQNGTHAAGLVIASEKIEKIVPTILNGENLLQTQFSMNYLEQWGLIKIDLLGLKNLTTLKEVEDEVYRSYKKKIEWRKINYHDKKTNDLLSAGHTEGVFQLESPGMKRTLREVGVSSIDDLIVIISLYRPGPLQQIDSYVKRKKGREPIPKVSKVYDEVLKNTFGIMVYQEQVMEILRQFSGVNFAHADILRRAISKKEAALILSLKKKFIDGAIALGNSKGLSEEVFSLIEKFANYGFNKSHSVSYAMLAYKLAFLKARFPFEFYTALLRSSHGSQSSIAKYVHEAVKMSIKINMPNVTEARAEVFNDQKAIFLPLKIIKGLGAITSVAIINERSKGSFKSFFDFTARMRLHGLGAKTFELLIHANALRHFGNMATLENALVAALRYANMVVVGKDTKHIDQSIISEPIMVKKESDLQKESEFMKEALGFKIASNETLKYENKIRLCDVKENGSAKVVAFVEEIKSFTDKNGKTMGIATLSDSSGSYKVTIFHNLWPKINQSHVGKVVRVIVQFRKFKEQDKYNLKSAWEVVDV